MPQWPRQSRSSRCGAATPAGPEAGHGIGLFPGGLPLALTTRSRRHDLLFPAPGARLLATPAVSREKAPSQQSAQPHEETQGEEDIVPAEDPNDGHRNGHRAHEKKVDAQARYSFRR